MGLQQGSGEVIQRREGSQEKPVSKLATKEGDRA